MKTLRLLTITLLLFAGFTSLNAQQTLTWEDPDIAFFKCIWDEAPHSAFTDLIAYNDRYYCAFREAASHVPASPAEYGKIRLLVSDNGEEWQTAALLEDKDFDLRDPKLSVTPDNRLMVIYGCSYTDKDGKYFFNKMQVSFSRSNKTKEIHLYKGIDINLDLPQYWLWKPVWHKDTVYGIAYTGTKPPVLVKSRDGINYDIVQQLDDIPGANESDILFEKNDRMRVLIRKNGENGFVGESAYPYTSWKWEKLTNMLHSPKIITIDDYVLVTGRGSSKVGEKTVYHNVLYYLDGNNNKELYVFPGNGDSAYPGAIQVKDEVWFSYYATPFGKTSIYFTKISVSKIKAIIRGLK